MKTISIHDDRKTVEGYIKGLNLCEKEFIPFINSKSQSEWVGRLFMNYDWLKSHRIEIPEIENITPVQYSTYFLWVLETYGLGKGVDSVVQAVIDLHKRRVIGEEVSDVEWSAASDAARDAAWYAARYAARYAASSAASDAAISKMGEIILGINE